MALLVPLASPEKRTASKPKPTIEDKCITRKPPTFPRWCDLPMELQEVILEDYLHDSMVVIDEGGREVGDIDFSIQHIRHLLQTPHLEDFNFLGPAFMWPLKQHLLAFVDGAFDDDYFSTNSLRGRIICSNNPSIYNDLYRVKLPEVTRRRSALNTAKDNSGRLGIYDVATRFRSWFHR